MFFQSKMTILLHFSLKQPSSNSSIKLAWPTVSIGSRGVPESHQMNHRAQVFSIRGDHDFFANTPQLPHWQAHMPCSQCELRELVWSLGVTEQFCATRGRTKALGGLLSDHGMVSSSPSMRFLRT